MVVLYNSYPYKKQKFHPGTLINGKRGGNCRCKDMKFISLCKIFAMIFLVVTKIRYTTPFTSKMQTSRSWRISLESRS